MEANGGAEPYKFTNTSGWSQSFDGSARALLKVPSDVGLKSTCTAQDAEAESILPEHSSEITRKGSSGADIAPIFSSP